MLFLFYRMLFALCLTNDAFSCKNVKHTAKYTLFLAVHMDTLANFYPKEKHLNGLTVEPEDESRRFVYLIYCFAVQILSVTI